MRLIGSTMSRTETDTRRRGLLNHCNIDLMVYYINSLSIHVQRSTSYYRCLNSHGIKGDITNIIMYLQIKSDLPGRNQQLQFFESASPLTNQLIIPCLQSHDIIDPYDNTTY